MTSAARPSTGQPSGNALLRLYHGQTNYDFINRWKIWFAMSGTVILIGLISLAVGGLNFSIDFKGGSVWQVPTNASVATVRGDLGNVSSLLGQATILQLTNQQTGQKNIEVEASSSITGNTQLVNKVTDELASIAQVPVREVNATLIGPSWGSSISKKAIEAVVVFLVLIAIAISLYFESKMAVGALVALLHDILVTVGIYALSGFQVSPDTVIAFLTVMGYSLYDTIVVFDKVKENTKGLASTNRVTYTDVVNLSMNQVLARSVNTSFVAIMPVFCILVIGAWVLGASALNDFGLALFIGLLSGAYSSIFIASPILALLKEREPRYVEIRRRLAAYPQSRQVLTAAMVSGGAVVAPRSSLTRGAERPSGQQPALTAASGAGALGSGSSAGRSVPVPAASALPTAGAGAAWPGIGAGSGLGNGSEGLGDPRRLGYGAGHDDGQGDGAREPARPGRAVTGAGPGAPGASGGPGSPGNVPRRPAPGAKKGGRPVAPRPRKKTPRKR